MQSEPSAPCAPPRRTVSGLGVCDALRLELQAVQLPGLVDELDAHRGPLEEQLARAAESDERDRCRYQLRLLGLLRAQLPAAGHATAFVVAGPAALTARIARGALRDAAAALSELAAQPTHASPSQRLRDAAAAASAWATTVLDCQAVEAYDADPEAEPHDPW
jgi:hypothetical protein